MAAVNEFPGDQQSEQQQQQPRSKGCDGYVRDVLSGVALVVMASKEEGGDGVDGALQSWPCDGITYAPLVGMANTTRGIGTPLLWAWQYGPCNLMCHEGWHVPCGIVCSLILHAAA